MEQNNRQTKVGALIQKELAEMFRKMVKDNNLKNTLISVTKVLVTKDLSMAKVYVSIYPFDKSKTIIKEIISLKQTLRYQLSRLTKNQLRKTPELSFFNDDSFNEIENIEQALENDDPII